MIDADYEKAQPGTQVRVLVAIVVAALVLRLALLVLLQGYLFDVDWDFGYETGSIAKSLATGGGFSSPFQESSLLSIPPSPTGPTAWLMPVFPGLLALVFEIFGVYSTGSAVAILTINSLFSSLTCIGIFLVGQRVFGQPTALLASGLFALDPPSIWHSITTVWDTSLFAFLVVFTLWGFYRLKSRPGPGGVGAYGAWFGAVALVNAVILVFAGFVAVWLLVSPERPKRWRIGVTILFISSLAVVLSPWLLRNYMRFDSFYLRSNLGVELRLGNSDATWQDYEDGMHTAAPLLAHPAVIREEFDRYASMGEAAYARWAMDEALQFIARHPTRFLKLSLRRARFFWLSDLGTEQEWTSSLDVPLSSAAISLVKKACHLLPLPFMLIGIVAACRQRLDVAAPIGLLVLLPPIYYLTHVTERYRFPIEAIILLLASYGLITMWVALQESRVRTS